MKKLILNLIAVFFLLSIIPARLNAKTEISNGTKAVIFLGDTTGNSESEIAKTLILRLHEIKDMDKSNLSAIEKKNLKNEVRTIKSELKTLNGGIYLTVGEFIIIILLLIIIL